MKPTNGHAVANLIDRNTVLAEARLLLSKEVFSHEDASRCSRLMDLSDRLPGGTTAPDGEMAEFRAALRTVHIGGRWQVRDMTVGSPGSGGYFVPVGFREFLAEALKAYDRLFDEDVVTLYQTERGAQTQLPILDDTASSAQIISEAAQTIIEDPSPGAQQVTLSPASTWRSGLIRTSIELLQDSAFDPAAFLARSCGIRIARGVGGSLAQTLLAGAMQGAVAVGSSGNTGGAETGGTSIGTDDLFSLVGSLNPAYLSGPKVRWAMNWTTLLGLWKLKDKQGRPILRPQFNDAGEPMLLGFPVAVCPSLPAVAANATPICFGNLAYFVLRTVPQATTLKPITEKWAEYGQVGWQTYWRGNGALTCAQGADSPVKFLQCASS